MFTLCGIDFSGVETTKEFSDYADAAQEAMDNVLNGVWISSLVRDSAGRVVWTLSHDELMEEMEIMNQNPDELSDDAWVLASAGFGTNEDYGYYGDDNDF